MQINGLSEFAARITSLNGVANAKKSSFLPIQQPQISTDSLMLSDAGRKLSLNVDKAPTLTENAPRRIDKLKEKMETATLDPTLQVADDSMAQAENILTRIHDLTTLAQDEKLTDFERVNLQIEIEDLRTNLVTLPQNLPLQEQSEPSVDSLISELKALLPPELSGNGTSVLSRMRDRILNEEEWDVREAFSTDRFSRVKNDGDTEIQELYQANKWYAVENQHVLTQRSSVDGELENVATSQKVPTVREVLESRTPFVVMDAESAVEATKLAEQQIADVRQWRDKIAQANASMQSDQVRVVNPDDILNEVYIALDNLVFPNGVERTSLTEPDVPKYFLKADGVYNTPYVFSNIHDGSDLSLAGADNKPVPAPAYYDTAELSDRALDLAQEPDNDTVSPVIIKQGY